MTKKQLQELKYLENEKSFYVEIEVFFVILKWLSMKKITGTFLESENLTLNSQVTQDIPPNMRSKTYEVIYILN